MNEKNLARGRGREIEIESSILRTKVTKNSQLLSHAFCTCLHDGNIDTS